MRHGNWETKISSLLRPLPVSTACGIGGSHQRGFPKLSEAPPARFHLWNPAKSRASRAPRLKSGRNPSQNRLAHPLRHFHRTCSLKLRKRRPGRFQVSPSATRTKTRAFARDLRYGGSGRQPPGRDSGEQYRGGSVSTSPRRLRGGPRKRPGRLVQRSLPRSASPPRRSSLRRIPHWRGMLYGDGDSRRPMCRLRPLHRTLSNIGDSAS